MPASHWTANGSARVSLLPLGRSLEIGKPSKRRPVAQTLSLPAEPPSRSTTMYGCSSRYFASSAQAGTRPRVDTAAFTGVVRLLRKAERRGRVRWRAVRLGGGMAEVATLLPGVGLAGPSTREGDEAADPTLGPAGCGTRRSARPEMSSHRTGSRKHASACSSPAALTPRGALRAWMSLGKRCSCRSFNLPICPGAIAATAASSCPVPASYRRQVKANVAAPAA